MSRLTTAITIAKLLPLKKLVPVIKQFAYKHLVKEVIPHGNVSVTLSEQERELLLQSYAEYSHSRAYK